MTFGCQDLSRHFNTLMFNSCLSNSLPKPMRWLTMWVTLFCTSVMDSTCFILNSSYSWIRACFLALLTSLIPSWVTSRTSHISLALLHCETRKNSSMLRDEVRIFFALQSYWAFLLSSSFHWVHGLLTCTSSTICLGIYGPFMIASHIP